MAASSGEPDVHAVLTANRPRIVKIRMVVIDLLLGLAVELASRLTVRNRIQRVPMNSRNFARLKKPIGKLTEAASAQTSSSRKLKEVLSKMVVVWFSVCLHYL